MPHLKTIELGTFSFLCRFESVLVFGLYLVRMPFGSVGVLKLKFWLTKPYIKSVQLAVQERSVGLGGFVIFQMLILIYVALFMLSSYGQRLRITYNRCCIFVIL